MCEIIWKSETPHKLGKTVGGSRGKTDPQHLYSTVSLARGVHFPQKSTNVILGVRNLSDSLKSVFFYGEYA